MNHVLKPDLVSVVTVQMVYMVTDPLKYFERSARELGEGIAGRFLIITSHPYFRAKSY